MTDPDLAPAHPLDNPVRSSLAGPHSRFALRRGAAARYPADVCPFAAMPDQPRAADWDDLAALAGPGAVLAFAGLQVPPPDGWGLRPLGEGVQLTDAGVDVGAAGAASDGEIVRLGPADVPEMLDLASRTRPGPFLRCTIELGTYLGIRRGDGDRAGALVAMAGERLNPPGWTEISAVCTDQQWRGHGFATRLVRALVAGIRARGETAFLHAVADNTDAIRLYQQMGFRLRTTTVFCAVRVPAR